MLDLNLIRSNPEYVKEALKKREYDVDFSELLSGTPVAARCLWKTNRSRPNATA